MTPAGIEPGAFRFVAQHLNHCATADPIHIIFIYLLQLGCHPVAVVILHVYKI